MNEPIRSLQSRYVLLPTENIDTDQILPARFLLVTTREGLGAHLFADWRRDAEGRPRPEFPLNSPQAQGAQVLVAGRNFGCGSSREHAAWALRDHGFRAVVSTGIADIFRRNAIRNGVVPVDLTPEAHAALVASAGGSVVVDVGARTLTLPDGTRAPFPLEPFARYCLMEGVDELGFLLAQEHAIATHEARGGSDFSTHHPNPKGTAGATKMLP
jgi:3-isopropylmalate/(R)-2-methylmalate dehydratase small subunit